MENAKKNLVFHFGVGRQASSFQIGYVKDWSEMKMTNVFSKISLVKSSKFFFIFLSVFYLTICLMKALKSFGKRGILKTWELVSLGGAKIHFGKIAMK